MTYKYEVETENINETKQLCSLNESRSLDKWFEM